MLDVSLSQHQTCLVACTQGTSIEWITKRGLNAQMGVPETDFTSFTCCQGHDLLELHRVSLTPEKTLLKSILWITKDSENVNSSVQAIPKPRCTTQSTCHFLLMGDNVSMSLEVCVPTSEALDITVGHQHCISMNRGSGVLGKIIKVILEPMVRFPIVQRWGNKDCLLIPETSA